MLVVTKASPVNYSYDKDGTVVSKQNWGGVASAFLGALQDGDTWIALSEGDANEQRMRNGQIRIPHNGKTINLRPLIADQRIVDGFLNYSNLGLWFLSHAIAPRGQIPDPQFTFSDFLHYDRLNAIAAEAVRHTVGAAPETPALVNDYQFSRLALIARRNGTMNPLGNFLHIPLPEHELLRETYGKLSPEELAYEKYIDDFLNYDLIGLHTHEYLENLATTSGKIYPTMRRTDEGDKTYLALPNGRKVTISVRPIGVDVETIAAHARTGTLNAYLGTDLPEGHEELGAYMIHLREHGAEKIIGSMERVDPTKGIRLGDIEWLLANGHRVAYIGVFARARETLQPYIDERQKLNEYASRINQRFAGALGYQPITIINEGLSTPNNYLFLRDLDIVYPGHKRDGFDLVALETLIAQGTKPERERGSLVVGNCGVRESFEDFSPPSGFFSTAGHTDDARRRMLAEAVESGYRISDSLVAAARARGDINAWMNGLKEDLYGLRR